MSTSNEANMDVDINDHQPVAHELDNNQPSGDNQLTTLIDFLASQQATLSALFTSNGALTGGSSKPVRAVDVKLNAYLGGLPRCSRPIN